MSSSDSDSDVIQRTKRPTAHPNGGKSKKASMKDTMGDNTTNSSSPDVSFSTDSSDSSDSDDDLAAKRQKLRKSLQASHQRDLRMDDESEDDEMKKNAKGDEMKKNAKGDDRKINNNNNNNIDQSYRIFSQDDHSDSSSEDDEDGSKLRNYEQNRDVLLQLYTQNKLQSISLWEWQFTSKLHHFILSTSAETTATSTTGQQIDFGEKAQLIDATTTLYGYKVQNLHDQTLKLIEKNSPGAKDGENDEIGPDGEKKKKDRKKELASTTENISAHSNTDPEVNHNYDMIFTEATRNLSTTVGIKTLLCYNTKVDFDGVNLICDSERDQYRMYQHAIDPIQEDQNRIYLMEEQYGVVGGGNGRRLGPTATEGLQLEYRERLQQLDSALRKRMIGERLLAERIDTVMSPLHTINSAIDITSLLSPSLVMQKKALHEQLRQFVAEKGNRVEINPVAINIDTSLQMFLYDINQKEQHYNRLMALGGNSRSLEELLQDNIAVNTDVIDPNFTFSPEDPNNNDDDNTASSSSSAGRKKPIDPDQLRLHAEKALYKTLTAGVNEANIGHYEKDDDFDDDDVISLSSSSKTSKNSKTNPRPSSKQSQYYLLSSKAPHPLPFNREAAISALAGVMGMKKSQNEANAIPKQVLNQLNNVNMDVSSRTITFLSRAQNDIQEYDQGAFLPHQQELYRSCNGIGENDTDSANSKKKSKNVPKEPIVANNLLLDDEEKEKLMRRIKMLPAEKRYPINNGFSVNNAVVEILTAPFNEQYSYMDPFPVTLGENKAGTRSSSRRSTSEVKETNPVQPTKRLNIFDFSGMSVGKINNLPTRQLAKDDDDDLYYLAKGDQMHKKWRQSYLDGYQDDDDFQAELEILENTPFSGALLGPDGQDIVQLTPNGQKGPKSGLLHQPIQIQFNTDYFDEGDMYQPEEVEELMEQHQSLQNRHNQQNNQQNNQNYNNNNNNNNNNNENFSNDFSSAQRQETSAQRAIFERIRNGNAGNDEYVGEMDGNSGQHGQFGVKLGSNSRKSLESQSKLYTSDLQYGLTSQMGSLTSSLDAILRNQYGNSATEKAREEARQERRRMKMLKREERENRHNMRRIRREERRKARMGDGDEDNDNDSDDEKYDISTSESSDTTSESDNYQEQLPEKPLSMIQLNILRKQRNTHRLYQKLLKKEENGDENDQNVEEKAKKRPKGRQAIDSDNSDNDPEDDKAGGTKKGKKVTKKKVSSIDVADVIRGDQIPLTPAVQLYLQTAPTLSLSALKGSKMASKRARAMNDDNDDDGSVKYLVQTLDKGNYESQVKCANKLQKKLTSKQLTFLNQQRLLFDPSHELENESYQSGIDALVKSNQHPVTGAVLGGVNRNLLPRFVSSKGSFLQPLLSLSTRPNIMFPVQIPTASYQQATNVDNGVFINLVRSKQIYSNYNTLSHTYQQQKLINTHREKQQKQQQQFSNMVAQMSNDANNYGSMGSSTTTTNNNNNNGYMGRNDDNNNTGDSQNNQNNPFGANFLAPINDDNDANNYDEDFLADFDNEMDIDADGLDQGMMETGGLNIDDLQKMLDQQNLAMLQKQSEGDDFFNKMRQDHSNLMNDDELEENNGNGLFGVNNFMAQFNPNNVINNDPFGINSNNNGDFDDMTGKSDDAFRTTLFDQQEGQALKHATVSKYFNMRQLKSRLLQKVTRAQLRRVKLVNLRQLLKNQAQSLLKNNQNTLPNQKELSVLAKSTGELPNLSREAFVIENNVKTTAPSLLYSHPDNAQSSQYNDLMLTKDLPNVQQVKGGQSGECYQTTFRDVTSQIQFEYDDRDVRSISTFFLSLLILSNETNLELRPKVDESKINNEHNNDDSMNDGVKNDQKDDENDALTTSTSSGNKDPLSLGYIFSDFDIYIPLNARDTKRQQLMNSKNQTSTATAVLADSDAKTNSLTTLSQLTPAKKRMSLTPNLTKDGAKGAAKASIRDKKTTVAKKGAKSKKNAPKKGKNSKKSMNDDDDEDDFIGSSDDESTLSDSSSSSDDDSSDSSGSD